MTTIKDEPSLSSLDEAALHFHEYPTPGKLQVNAKKPLTNQQDMTLAYSPGVAAPCLAIHDDPKNVSRYTIRGNLIAVVSNGSAVLGLGNIGPLASKPVMEGKAVLFKEFANIDVFDIEIDAPDIDSMVSTIAALEPTFGGINLEDIKAPECFEVEAQLRKLMKIPVFHDDQHGTAIIVAAAVINGLYLSNKKIEEVKIVTSGAGAAALACLNLLVSLGAKKENIWVTDLDGVVYKGRSEIDRWKNVYAQDTDARVLADVIADADIFLGLSAAGVLKAELLKEMAPSPLILALANPTPEIMPEEARAVRPDAIICTGRSDYTNQVNNVLCFPHIFRGALDVEATEINEQMKIAAVHAIAELARTKSDDSYGYHYIEQKTFGPDYLIPSPFDKRLILHIAPAVARVAMETGVAQRPITDWANYLEKLQSFAFGSGLFMKPVFSTAKKSQCNRVIYSDGEDERVLHAIQILIDEKLACPILIGRPHVIESRLKRLDLKIKPGIDFQIINPENDPRYREYVSLLLERMGRKGITPDAARVIVRTSTTAIAALALIRDEADAMICGLNGRFFRHIHYIQDIIGLRPGVTKLATLSILSSHNRVLFLTDTHVNLNPSATDLLEIVSLAIEEVKKFGTEPKIALLSHSDFGAEDTESAQKMRQASAMLLEKYPHLSVDGEMQASTALSEELRKQILPNSTLRGDANLLVFPNLDSANISFSLLKSSLETLHIGPILLGTAKPTHILINTATPQDIMNVTALAIAQTQT